MEIFCREKKGAVFCNLKLENDMMIYYNAVDFSIDGKKQAGTKIECCAFCRVCVHLFIGKSTLSNSVFNVVCFLKNLKVETVNGVVLCEITCMGGVSVISLMGTLFFGCPCSWLHFNFSV